MSNALRHECMDQIGAAPEPPVKPTEPLPGIAPVPVVRASGDNSSELAALVMANDTSVRLRNSVIAAADAGTLPFASVHDYLRAGTMAVPTMMRNVRNFGAKSARELDLLVRATGDVTTAAAEIIMPAQDGPNPREILEAIQNLSLGQAIEGEILSVRLQNGLAAPDLQMVRFSTIALALDNFLATLRTRPNIGRTSVKEMARLVGRLTPRLLAEYGVAPAQIARTCEALFGESRGVDADEVADDVPRFETLAACLDWLLTRCEARDRLIIERRFGLGQTPPETLEDIGSDYGVTRERIRQIEKRALKRMRVSMRRVPLADYIASAAPAGWLQISEGRGWISDRQADAALRKLDGVLQLCLELVETSPRAWLSAIATRAPHGWIGAPIDPALTRAAAIDLGALLNLPLPRSLSEAGGYDRLHAEAALRIELGRELEQGYVVQSRAGPRMRRALGLHRLLVSASTPLAAQYLIPRYHQLCPTDPCSARDVDIVMQAAPHLFIETFDQVWFGIGACGDPPGLDDLESYVRNHSPPYGEQNAADDGETCAEALIAALERRGPERLLTLYQNAQDVLPPGRSSNSVGPTLVSNPHLFVRLLPGVYGLHHQVPSSEDLLAAPPSYLLENSQLRLLALARRAGERRDVFPLWSLEGEFSLVRWGRHYGSPENYRSMLAVADIAAWPISPSERAHWTEVARHEGRFELAEAPHPDAYVRPELDRLLAACIEALKAGVLNWMAVNRMAGRRIDSHAAVSVMAILLALGVLHCDSADPSAWQRPHRATDRAEALITQLIGELSSTGVLSWDRGTGLKLQSEVRAVAADMEGWPEPTRLAKMFEGGGAPHASATMAIDPVDAIMAESRQYAEMQKREDLLRWLLEE